MKLIVTGDTHGEQGRFYEIMSMLQKYDSNEEIYLAIMGDCGLLFGNTFSEHKFLNELEGQNFTIIVIPGNHENYDEFQKCEIVDFHGAKAHRVRKNIFYICRGEIFELGGKAFFCMGGGYSIDRYMRRKNISYWDDEMPQDEEYKRAAENIELYRSSGNKIDYIFSHTAPVSGLVFLGKSHGQEEYPLNNFLEYVRELLVDEYTMHYFGHLHVDREIPTLKQRAVWFDYIEIDLEDKNE